MREKSFRYFEFGELLLDTHRRVLRKKGVEVHLTPRTFDLLCVMVENAGRVLEHDELLDKVWADAFVEQGNLKKAVSSLRRALGESPDASEFIVTVPRRGYRFGASVRPIPDEAILIRETHAEITVEEEIDDGPATKLLTRHKRSLPFKAALAVGCGLILIVAAVAGWRFWPANSPRFSANATQAKRVMSESNIIGGTLSPDGNYFCYVVSEGQYRSLWLRQVATESSLQIIPPVWGSFWEIAFSPDGNFVFYTLYDQQEPSKSGVYRVAAFGGVSQIVVDSPNLGLKVSPDGKRVMMIRMTGNGVIDTQEIFSVNVDGSDEKAIAALPMYSLFRGTAWSPDGSSVLYAVKKQFPGEKAVHYVSEVAVNGGAETVLMPEQERPVFIDEWMPDKRSFIFRTREQNSEIYQIRQYFPATGETLRVTNDDFSYSHFTVTNNGTTLGGIRTFGLNSIWKKDGANESEQVATGSFFSINWTADNRFVFSTTENGKEYVGIMAEDGKNRRLLTDGSDGIRPYPAIAGDHRQITFASERGGSRQVWRMDPDGRNLKQLTNVESLGEGRLLADGQTVIFDTYVKSATWCVFKQTADGKTTQLTDTDTIEWNISPDEKLLAFYTTDAKTKKKRVIVREIETGREVKSFDVESLWSLHFSPDSKAVDFVRITDDLQAIVRLPLDGTPERTITTVRGEGIANFSWSGDGSRLALVRSKTQYEAVLIRSE